MLVFSRKRLRTIAGSGSQWIDMRVGGGGERVAVSRTEYRSITACGELAATTHSAVRVRWVR